MASATAACLGGPHPQLESHRSASLQAFSSSLLEAWGASPHLFSQGFATVETDPRLVGAALEKPGVVLRRQFGSKGEFQETPRTLRAPKASAADAAARREREQRETAAAERAERQAAKERAREEATAAREEQRSAKKRQREETVAKRTDQRATIARAKKVAARHHDQAKATSAARQALQAKLQSVMQERKEQVRAIEQREDALAKERRELEQSFETRIIAIQRELRKAWPTARRKGRVRRMGTIWRVLYVSGAGVGALLMFGAQNDPDTAVSNLSKWLGKIPGVHDIPRWLSDPVADNWIFWGGGVLLLVSLGLVLWSSWRSKKGPARQIVVPPEQHFSQRLDSPVNDAVREALREKERRAVAKALNPQADASIKWAHNYLVAEAKLGKDGDMVIWDELRQAGRDGTIAIWGRPHGPSVSVDKFYKPRERVPEVHWRDFGFDTLRCFLHDDERECRTTPDNDRSLRHDQAYADLRVNKAQVAAKWPRKAN